MTSGGATLWHHRNSARSAADDKERERTYGEWKATWWTSGHVIVTHAPTPSCGLRVENTDRIKGNTRPKGWYVVARNTAEAEDQDHGDWAAYPPVVLGPFKTMQAAMAAYLIIQDQYPKGD